jgi:protein-tyrosine phosphatase
MIDMHCHLVYNIDDGSKSVEETLNMAKKAEKLGYDAIFATPHFIAGSHETDKTEIYEKLENINNILNDEGCNLKVFEGNEVYFVSDVLQLIEDGCICTLNKSRYFLMEFPMSGLVLNMEQIITNVIRAGYVPIIAHPERYEFVEKDIKKLLPLVEAGALLQINVGSITGLYGSAVKKNVIKLIKNDMVHFIGTDAHDTRKVYDVYEKAMKKISKLMDSETLDIILNENPDKVLENEIIYPWEPKLK